MQGRGKGVGGVVIQGLSKEKISGGQLPPRPLPSFDGPVMNSLFFQSKPNLA